MGSQGIVDKTDLLDRVTETEVEQDNGKFQLKF